jgi:hypothetical protein
MVGFFQATRGAFAHILGGSNFLLPDDNAIPQSAPFTPSAVID